MNSKAKELYTNKDTVFRDTDSIANWKDRDSSQHIKKFKKDKHSSVGLLRAVNRRKNC